MIETCKQGFAIEARNFVKVRALCTRPMDMELVKLKKIEVNIVERLLLLNIFLMHPILLLQIKSGYNSRAIFASARMVLT